LEAPKHYRTLGLREGASIEEIKEAYRNLVKQYHPDITKDPATGEIFKRVVAAYKTLTVMERKRTLMEGEVRSTASRPGGSPSQRRTASSAAQKETGRKSAGQQGTTQQGPGQQSRPKEVDIHQLGRLVTEGFTPQMRAFAVRRLGYSGKRSAYAYLRRGLYDSSQQVVCATVQAVGRLQVVQCAGELASLFSRSNRTVRMEILAAVENIGSRPAFDPIIALGMNCTDRAVRSRAEELYTQSERRTG
jgi:DnaJ-class molecular chaperone